LPHGENTDMKYNPDKHHRKSIRLKHYDYSQAGFYFVTIVAQHRQQVFGDIENGVLIPNTAGDMIETVWYELPDRFPHVSLDAFVVMPNHIHGIIVINNETSLISNNTVTNTQTPFAPNPNVGGGLVPAPAQDTNELTFHKTKQIDGETAFLANDTVGASTREAPTDAKTPFIANMNDSKRPTLGDVVGAFKSLTTHAYILGVRENGWTPFDKRLWQRNYYERIIRNDDALTKARAYIEANPQNWPTDSENTTHNHAEVQP
jgi:putative transposase